MIVSLVFSFWHSMDSITHAGLFLITQFNTNAGRVTGQQQSGWTLHTGGYIRGFSVVELVIVILIAGILSAAVISRVLRSDTYNEAITRDQLVSLARSAQQKAIGRDDVRLVLQPSGNRLNMRIEDGGGVVQTVSTALDSVELRGDVNTLASCGVTAGAQLVSAGSPMSLYYNSLGDLLKGGVGAPVNISTGARVCINSNPLMSVCISAAGYAYVGDCVD
jgi:MSHA pilin protein MshC